MQDNRLRAQDNVLEDRCLEMAARVNAGEVKFLDAIDVLQDAAVASGLADQIGDDAVQEVMADAFMDVRR